MFPHAYFGGLWLPISHPSLIAWYDASDTSSITGTTTVTEWVDKKNGYDLAPGIGPESGSRTYNDLNVLDFTGSEWLHYAGNIVPASGNLAIYMVAGVDAIDSPFDALWSIDGPDTDFQFDSNDNGSTGDFYGEIAGGMGTNVATSGGPYNGPSIYGNIFDWDGSTVGVYIDGTNDGSQTYGTQLSTTQTEWNVFTNRVQNQQIDGWCGEIVVMEDCSYACRITIEGYLAHKWGLTGNLGASHPYKNYAPTI